ncbi:MAG: DUF996 domain-containing protein [Thermoprotei archaeon]|nr:DUF996 domain-containing protein [Thermoprotei archaeon]
MISDLGKARIRGVIGGAIIILCMVGVAIGIILGIIGVRSGGFLAIIVYVSFGFVLGYLSIVFSCLGWILVLISLYMLSRFYGEGGIFRNALYFTILYIVGIAVGTIAIFGWRFISEIFGLTEGGALGAAPVLWLVFFALASYFMYMSLSFLAWHSGVTLFRAAGALLLIGALLELILTGILVLGGALAEGLIPRQLIPLMAQVLLLGLLLGLLVLTASAIFLTMGFLKVKPFRQW